MNFIKSNLTKMVLCALFVVSIQASDKTELITTKQKKALPPETVPVEYVSPTQPAKGIRLAAPTIKLGDYKFSAQKQIGVKSRATGLPERIDDRAIEAVIQKYLQGAALTVAEEKVLRNNIN